MAKKPQPLTDAERRGIELAVGSALQKLKNLYDDVQPIYADYGFTPPSQGVIARDLSEKIEKSIIQHCRSFKKGKGRCDLCRFDEDWEVKVFGGNGMTINQSKHINGENYIVVNYDRQTSEVRRIWVLWRAQDGFFSPKTPHSNSRSLNRGTAAANIELLFERPSLVDDAGNH